MLIRLDCAAQNYAWGKIGKDSQVANYGINACKDLSLKNEPYAELWMGTHAKGPSKLYSSGQKLSQYLSANRFSLGTHLDQRTPGNSPDIPLPFLFKVLSVNQALSVQVHPTKEQAQILHRNDPKNYPDDNHKPEMAIALTPFQMMCGFRPISEIISHLENVPALLTLVGEHELQLLKASENGSGNGDNCKAALKSVFTAYMTRSPQVVENAIEEFGVWLEKNENINLDASLIPLVKRLLGAFPGDIGVFAPFFLNCFELRPGEATFLGPNEPHAYLLGDCMECMACSDNTIRAGLTPKFKDVKNLCDLLTYRTGTPEDNKMTSKPDSADKNVTLYIPPVEDFAVRKVEGSAKYQILEPSPLSSCSILIITTGTATTDGLEGVADKGMVFFCPANNQIKWTVQSGPFVYYEAFWNVK